MLQKLVWESRVKLHVILRHNCHALPHAGLRHPALPRQVHTTPRLQRTGQRVQRWAPGGSSGRLLWWPLLCGCGPPLQLPATCNRLQHYLLHLAKKQNPAFHLFRAKGSWESRCAPNARVVCCRGLWPYAAWSRGTQGSPYASLAESCTGPTAFHRPLQPGSGMHPSQLPSSQPPAAGRSHASSTGQL